VDLYRLRGVEIDDLGLDELASGEAVVAIEWADAAYERVGKKMGVI
jgi:tRNA A37 threonylcarbamoyladenosine biosynthesis protein TsaE